MAIHPTYSRNFYVGKSIDRNKLDKLKIKLEKHPLFAGVFVISIARNSSDQLEIYSARQLAQKYYQNNPPYIIGIARSYGEALDIIQQITEECLKTRKDCALKEFLLWQA